ncbi:MAG: DctP family TRAP transporter solute-binding subunit [Maritimibacter sp.]
MKYLSCAATALILGAGLAAPALADTAGCDDGEMVIKFSHVTNTDKHPKGIAANLFMERVNAEMDGTACMEVYPNSTLYNDDQVLEAMLQGDVQFAAPSLSKFETFTKVFRIFDLPFMFKNMDAVEAFQQSDAGQGMKNSMARRGLQGMDFWHNGLKQFSANVPLIKPEDAAGLKFRIMSSKVLEAQFKALDANPQVLPFSEVYSALQQRVVDAAENPLSNFYTKKFNEVQTDLTLSNHGYLGYMVITGKLFWKKLSDDQRALITQAMKEATEYGNKLAEDMDVRYLNEIKAAGTTTIHELTPEQRQA